MKWERHGGTHTRLHKTWIGMNRRCYDKTDNSYKYYGARGIVVCEEWRNSFIKFREWALANGYSDNLTIDRKDNDGNYEPSNCRWVTIKEQNRNTRNNRVMEAFGERKCLADWADDKRCVVEYCQLYHRVKKWTGHITNEQILTLPSDTKRKLINYTEPLTRITDNNYLIIKKMMENNQLIYEQYTKLVNEYESNT